MIDGCPATVNNIGWFTLIEVTGTSAAVASASLFWLSAFSKAATRAVAIASTVTGTILSVI